MWLGELWRRLVYLSRKSRASEDLAEEMRLHVELRSERLREAGVESDEAVYEARRSFGNRTQVELASRSAWGWTWLEALARDFQYASRTLRKNPSFSLVAILSLAAALGANTTVFSFVRAIVLNRLPVTQAERLVILEQHNDQFHMENCCFTYKFFTEIQKHDVGFEEMLAVTDTELNLTAGDETAKVKGELVSGNYFRILGIRPALGTLIGDEQDASEGAGHVAVISYRLWQTRFGGRQDVVGRRVLIDNVSCQIIGVTEPEFMGASLHEPADLQLPTSLVKLLWGDDRDSFAWARLIGRLKPGVTVQQAEAGLNVVGIPIEAATGWKPSERDKFKLLDGSQGLGSKKEQFAKPVLFLLGLVGVVLLIACANLTALLLVRSVERTSEAGVRMALGGSRSALMRHFLAESLTLATLGGIAGWGLAFLLTDALLDLMGTGGKGLEELVRPNATVFAFLAVLTLATGVLFGLLPAWKAAQCDPLLAIRGLATAAAGRRSLAPRMLIAGQLAMSLALLFGSGLFVQTLRNLRSIDVGFRPENVALLHLELNKTKYAEKGAGQFFEELLRRARAVPGARAASFSSISVLSGAMQAIVLKIPGYVSPNNLPPVTYYSTVSDQYFSTLGIPLRAGRDFSAEDRATGDAEGVAIVNERFAKEFFGGDALGKTLKYGGGRSVRVVGIAGSTRFRWLREEPKSVMYLPVTQWGFPQSLYLQVRMGDKTPAMIDRLRSVVRDMDQHVPIDSVTTMQLQIDGTLGRERLLAFLSTMLGGLAAALAAIGLFGVTSFSVAQRTREIGIRMAIGAARRTILQQFLGESGWTIAAGLAVGVPLALGCGVLAGSLLYGLKPQDPLTAFAAAIILIAIAVVAALIPAWRASRLDPLVALRWE
jgi:predicted permease